MEIELSTPTLHGERIEGESGGAGFLTGVDLVGGVFFAAVNLVGGFFLELVDLVGGN